MGLLIDTSVVVAIERKGGSLDVVLAALDEDEVAISAITASELIMGVILAKPESRRQRRDRFVENVLERVAVFPVDLSVARVHARIRSELTASGNLFGPHDMLIAATALARDFAVLTHNAREFERVMGLEVRAATL
jgi:predicted nucleic acid-binding protein